MFCLILVMNRISILAPRMGSDVHDFMHHFGIDISILAPRMGSDGENGDLESI